MTLLSLIIVLVLVGLIMWVINTYIPMAPTIKRILNVAVIILVILWLLKAFGLLDSLNTVRL